MMVTKNNKIILKGIQDKVSTLWMITIKHNKKVKLLEQALPLVPMVHAANSAYHQPTIAKLMACLNATIGSLPVKTLCNAIDNDWLTSFPGLTSKAIKKHLPKSISTTIQHTEAHQMWTHKIIIIDNNTLKYQYTPIVTMTSRSPTLIDEMLSLIPKYVQAALKAEFHLQVKTAYTKHLNDKLVAVQATVLQAALPSLPQTVPEITPAKAKKPVTETSGSNQGKRKASGTPTRSQPNSKNPFAVFATATIAAIAATTAAAVTTAVTTTAVATTAVTTTAATGTSSAKALEVPASDFDDTDDTIPPQTFPKKGHGLTIILGMNINNHLFLATVLAITEAPVEVKDLLPQLTNIGSRKDVRTTGIIGFLTTNGVELTPLTNYYEKIMRTNHVSSIIIKYSVTRHSFESKELPTSWLQFFILFQKEILIVPFSQKYEAINLGNQFNEQKWTNNFTHYCNHNLNFRIAPVDRVDNKGSQGPKGIIRGLHFNSTWAITMPTPDPKP
jgi:hypothetical protein